MDDIQTNSASGDFGHSFRCRESRQEQEVEQLRLGHGGDQFRFGQTALDDLASQAFQRDASAVIADRDRQHARAVPSFQPQHPLFWLRDARALFRSFQAVVDCVSQNVIQRRFQLFEDVAIDVGVVPHDFKLDLLAELPSEIPDHAWEALHAISERSHSAGDDFVIQPAIEVIGLPRVLIELADAIGQQIATFGDSPPSLLQQPCDAALLVCGRGRQPDVFQDGRDLVLILFEQPQRFGERLQPASFHERLARETHQSRQAVRRHADHSFFGSRIARERTRDSLGQHVTGFEDHRRRLAG